MARLLRQKIPETLANRLFSLNFSADSQVHGTEFKLQENELCLRAQPINIVNIQWSLITLFRLSGISYGLARPN
jgi:hypothetical protein